MVRALITEEFHPILIEGLSQRGIHCDEQWEVETPSVIDIIENYEILVINSKINVNKELLEKATRLKVIIRIGSGLEVVDLDLCNERQIKVLSTPEGNACAVAEHCLAFLLSGFRNLYKAQSEILQGLWIREGNRGEELTGKTIAILGCGNNGSRLVQLLNGFDVKILVYDIRDVRESLKTNRNASQVESMEEIYENADILSLHLPLNQSTNELVGRRFLESFKKPTTLMNTSRGLICNQTEVLELLHLGKLKKVMLDVFEEEPIKITEQIRVLCRENKLFLTPHIGGWTKESKRRMAEIALQKLDSLDFF